MKKLATWGGALALASSLLIAACGGSGGSTDTTQVRLINATLTHPSLTLLANGTAAISGVAVNSISGYSGVSSGSPALQLNDASTSAVLTTVAPTLTKDTHVAILAYEQAGAVKVQILTEETTAPTSGNVLVRIYDAATDAGPLDVYLTSATADITGTSPTFTLPASTQPQPSATLPFAPGTYRVRVTGQGSTSNVRLDIPTVIVADQQVLTIILTPTIGGDLVNGAALIQQGGYGAVANSSARARLFADVGGGATVTATIGSTTLSSGTISPNVGAYTQISVGTGTTSVVTVNGVALPAPTPLPTAGSDSTLVVYGNSAGTAAASFINDDNRLPTTTTALKIRLFNGLTGATSPLTLSADFSQVAVNVAAGQASPYATITPSTTLRLEVMSNNGTVYVESIATPPTNAVYTLFLYGDASAPSHLLRRDDR